MEWGRQWAVNRQINVFFSLSRLQMRSSLLYRCKNRNTDRSCGPAAFTCVQVQATGRPANQPMMSAGFFLRTDSPASTTLHRAGRFHQCCGRAPSPVQRPNSTDARVRVQPIVIPLVLRLTDESPNCTARYRDQEGNAGNNTHQPRNRSTGPPIS